MLESLRQIELYERRGRVAELRGQAIESLGPDAFLGELCEIHSGRGGRSILAEVVGFRDGRVCLTPFSDPHGISVGATVLALGHGVRAPVGDDFLGRVVDAMGQPMDGKPAPSVSAYRAMQALGNPPMTRRRIQQVLETGVKALDTALTVGRGQRIGLFAGSGVGKSTLLGMITRGVKADVNVVALIGERGREVREFVEDHLGEEGMRKAVVVVATAEAPAIMRLNAAYYATVLSEYFRDQGKSVLLTMDSLTRLAMARREIGLSSGEPPTSRGYTPSVFSEIPALCERCGTTDGDGSITGIYTVLVEGDDFNEPVSDTARATLDGHVMLSRELAASGIYPPIDLLHSVSRLASSLWTSEQKQMVREALQCLSLYERSRQLIDVGAYRAGTNPQLDRAVEAMPRLRTFFGQDTEAQCLAPQAWQALATALRGDALQGRSVA